MVAILRRAAGSRSDSPALAVRSGQFATRWSNHAHGPKTVHRDLAGDIHLQYQALILQQDPELFAVLCTSADPVPGLRSDSGANA
jgi:hypothetical protein